MSDYENFEDDGLSILDIVNEFKVLFFTNLKTIVFSGIGICFLTVLHLYNTPKQYVTYAKIKVLEEQETSAFVLEDMIDFSSGFQDKELLNNEIEIITSKNILEQVIQELKLNHSYIQVGVVTNVSLTYDTRPFSIEIATGSDSSKEFNIDVSVGQNTISNVNDEISTSFMFGKTFVLGLDTLKITKSSLFKSIEKNGGKYLFRISSSYGVFQSLKSRILLNPVTDMVLGISIKGTDPGLNVQIIETLLNAYASDGINDNKLISEGTSEFLSDRISLIKSEIGIIESSLSETKKKNDFIDIGSINALISNQKVISNDMTFEIETQTLIANSFLEKLNSQSISELLPLPIEVGISNSELSSFTGDFNKLVLERSALLKGRTKDNLEIYTL
ncbi:MAG: Wzz/FepE/Etk N-terminal domain-containing protein, partial [Flavobacteriales bacterium]|nr:Wzz/FepE/Etk N-terminal domain-containing protein [Flavobacteriales bacterium]